jgi:diacylglycerol kinase (ATP)
MSYIKQRLRAFVYAYEGLFKGFSEEPPFKIHLLATATVTALGFYFDISRTEWCILVLCCALVISLELMNTAIERLCDAVKPEQHAGIKFVKDAGAAAVLIAAAASVIVGTIIFSDYFKAAFFK